MADDRDSGVPQILSTSFLVKELENQEKIFNYAIKFYNSSNSYCLECGHRLNYNNYLLHYSIQIEETKKARKKLLDDQYDEEQVRFDMEWIRMWRLWTGHQLSLQGQAGSRMRWLIPQKNS